MNILLEGVVGSTAYGLATPDSDIDKLGVYACVTEQLFTLRDPVQTKTSKDPDWTLHEAGKYCRLALQCNPTVLELMWLKDYTTITPLGRSLVDIRSAFLSQKLVRNAYLGYATQQLRRVIGKHLPEDLLNADTHRNALAKHARHLYRLLIQGTELHLTGQLVIELEHPQECWDFGNAVAGGDTKLAEDEIRKAEILFDRARGALREKPQPHTVEMWLLAVRMQHLESVKKEQK